MLSKIVLSLTFLLAAVFILAPTLIEAQCNICKYGAACINETSFNLCFGETQDKSRVFHCPGDKLCSSTRVKCVIPDNGASCTPNKGCGVCKENKLFACTSRTTFVQCNGEELTDITGVCPEGLVCDSESGEICKDECNRPQELECDREAP